MNPIRLCGLALLIAVAAGAMSDTMPEVERRYDAAKDETRIHFMQKLEKRSNGELDLLAMFTHSGSERTAPVDRFTVAVMWIGLARLFSTPAIAAVEVDGEELYKELGRHGAEIDGGTIDENVAFDLPAAVLRRMAGGKRVVVRIDEMRLTLGEPHLARLRELLAAAGVRP